MDSRTEPFIWTTGVDSSNSVNYDQVKVLNYSMHSLLILPAAEIEPATSRWFHSVTPSNQTPYRLLHVFLLVYNCKDEVSCPNILSKNGKLSFKFSVCCYSVINLVHLLYSHNEGR